MSSNIAIQRICRHCGSGFIARTTVTRYCSDTCSKRAWKARKRGARVEESTAETRLILNHQLKAKEFLTVRDVAALLNCSIRFVYRQIDRGAIKAVNLGERMTRVKRTELDRLFY